jgi:adenylate kinase
MLLIIFGQSADQSLLVLIQDEPVEFILRALTDNDRNQDSSGQTDEQESQG